MDHSQLSRRRFVVSVVAILAATGLLRRPGALSISQALAESAVPLDEADLEAVVRMARLLFPHDALADDVYAGILEQAVAETSGSHEFAAHIEAAARALAERSDDAWLALDDAEQLDLMRSIEAEPYFAALQNQVRLGVYNSAKFWKHIGYPGPSKGFGGYLHRGAGDIDWLPEDE
jgi:hypothetical protein